MNRIVICLILNTLVLAAYAVELWKDYDVILDNNALATSRRKYIIKLIISTVVFFVALNAMYWMFNINTADIFYYFKYGSEGFA